MYTGHIVRVSLLILVHFISELWCVYRRYYEPGITFIHCIVHIALYVCVCANVFHRLEDSSSYLRLHIVGWMWIVDVNVLRLVLSLTYLNLHNKMYISISIHATHLFHRRIGVWSLEFGVGWLLVVGLGIHSFIHSFIHLFISSWTVNSPSWR